MTERAIQQSRTRDLVVRARTERGQTLSEYALVLLLVCAGSAAVFTALSGPIANAIRSVARLLP